MRCMLLIGWLSSIVMFSRPNVAVISKFLNPLDWFSSIDQRSNSGMPQCVGVTIIWEICSFGQSLKPIISSSSVLSITCPRSDERPRGTSVNHSVALLSILIAASFSIVDLLWLRAPVVVLGLVLSTIPRTITAAPGRAGEAVRRQRGVAVT